ncbi:MAG: hypothetical protein LBQ46_09730 [Treponema sp.]|jgi:hypothetical protein|nr:hypothetical protein [Treponema sp.]
MSPKLIDVLIQVVKSWEVLAVTGVLIVYIFLVSHAARGHKRPGVIARTMAKAKGGPAPTGEPDVETTDDLGLTEE